MDATNDKEFPVKKNARKKSFNEALFHVEHYKNITKAIK